MDTTKATILIIDDEPMNLDIIEAHLEPDNYNLIRADDGHQAWSLLQSSPQKFDVIILDRMMPGLDGMEVLANIRHHELLGQTPVIMQTARAENRDIVEGLKAGAFYYLTKPYDGNVLRAIVGSAVDVSLRNHNLLDTLQYKGVGNEVVATVKRGLA